MTTLQATVATVGLGLDIVGVCILFIFGLPFRALKDYVTNMPFRLKGVEPGPEHAAEERRIAAQEKRDRRINALGQWLGIVTLVTGFALQIVALWV